MLSYPHRIDKPSPRYEAFAGVKNIQLIVPVGKATGMAQHHAGGDLFIAFVVGGVPDIQIFYRAAYPDRGAALPPFAGLRKTGRFAQGERQRGFLLPPAPRYRGFSPQSARIGDPLVFFSTRVTATTGKLRGSLSL